MGRVDSGNDNAVYAVDKVSKNELISILSSMEEGLTALINTPGLVNFEVNYRGDLKMHLACRVFSKTFSPGEVVIKKRSWNEDDGFKYDVFTKIGDVEIFCIMTEKERVDFHRAGSADLIEPAVSADKHTA